MNCVKEKNHHPIRDNFLLPIWDIPYRYFLINSPIVEYDYSACNVNYVGYVSYDSAVYRDSCGYYRSPRSEMTMAVYACWINSMGSVYQYLDRSEITDSYGNYNSPGSISDGIDGTLIIWDGTFIRDWSTTNSCGLSGYWLCRWCI